MSHQSYSPCHSQWDPPPRCCTPLNWLTFFSCISFQNKHTHIYHTFLGIPNQIEGRRHSIFHIPYFSTFQSRKQTTEKTSSIYSPSILTWKDQSIFSTLLFSPEWEDIFSLLRFRRGWWIAFNLCSATGWNFAFFWKLVFKIRKQKFGNSSAIAL